MDENEFRSRVIAQLSAQEVVIRALMEHVDSPDVAKKAIAMSHDVSMEFDSTTAWRLRTDVARLVGRGE